MDDLTPKPAASPALCPEHLIRFRRRIAAGHYDQPAVIRACVTEVMRVLDHTPGPPLSVTSVQYRAGDHHGSPQRQPPSDLIPTPKFSDTTAGMPAN